MTRAGGEVALVCPTPSCPYAFWPQHMRSPLSKTAQPCALASVVPTTPPRPRLFTCARGWPAPSSKAIGEPWSVVAPGPSWRESDSVDACALEEKLREMKKQFEDLHNQAGDQGAFKGDVNIQADKQVQFRIIKKVMFSCASAGYGNISFATMSAGSGSEEKKPETAMR